MSNGAFLVRGVGVGVVDGGRMRILLRMGWSRNSLSLSAVKVESAFVHEVAKGAVARAQQAHEAEESAFGHEAAKGVMDGGLGDDTKAYEAGKAFEDDKGADFTTTSGDDTVPPHFANTFTQKDLQRTRIDPCTPGTHVSGLRGLWIRFSFLGL